MDKDNYDNYEIEEELEGQNNKDRKEVEQLLKEDLKSKINFKLEL
jgi:hypothetical protein